MVRSKSVIFPGIEPCLVSLEYTGKTIWVLESTALVSKTTTCSIIKHSQILKSAGVWEYLQKLEKTRIIAQPFDSM